MVETPARPSAAEVRGWLGTLTDPEIPVVSLLDMGMVHEVRWRDETLCVALRPTYSACPAAHAIKKEVEQLLADRGIRRFEVRLVLSPPWTTADLSAAAREKLRAWGIAPPSDRAPPHCPRCGSAHTTRLAQFGATACRALWRCEDCREPFDYFKPHR